LKPSDHSIALCIDDRRIRRAGCAHCAIRSKMLFADLDVTTIGPLLEAVTNTTLAAGDSIYRQGGDPAAIYSIRAGLVKLSQVSRDGDVRIVRLLGPGAAIGLEVLLEQPYHHSAEALSETDICHIPATILRQIAQQQAQLYQRLMQQWQLHIDIADQHLLGLSTGSIRDRGLRLLQLLEEICQRGDTPLVLPSNQDCAALLGARVESISRVMAEFKRAGVLERLARGAWQFNPDRDEQ
jgi:CRP/FNR family transcriptional regulator